MNVEPVVVVLSSERQTRNGSNHDGPSSSSLEPGERITRSRSSRQMDLETVLKNRSSSSLSFQKADPPGMQATELAASARERTKELEKKTKSNRRSSSPRRTSNRASSPRRKTNRTSSSPRRQSSRASSPRRTTNRSKSKDAEERHNRRRQSSERHPHHRATHSAPPPLSQRASDETRRKKKKESSSSKYYYKSGSSRSSSSRSSSSRSSCEKKKKVLVKRGQSFVIEMKEEEEGGMKASDKEKKEKVKGNSIKDVTPRKRSRRPLQDNSDYVEAESIFSWSRMMPNKDHMMNVSRQSFTTATTRSSYTSPESQTPKSERTDREPMLQSNKLWDEICSREATATVAKATSTRASARTLAVSNTANATTVDHQAAAPTRGGGNDEHVQGSKKAFGSITRDVLEEVMRAKLKRSPPKRQSSLQMIRKLSPTKSNRKMVLQSRPPPEVPEAAYDGEEYCPAGKLEKEEEEIIWTPDFLPKREQNNTINHTRTSSSASAKPKPIDQVKSGRKTEVVDEFSLSDFQAPSDLESEFNSLRLGDTAWFLQEDR